MPIAIKIGVTVVFIAVMAVIGYSVKATTKFMGPDWTFGFLCGAIVVGLAVWWLKEPSSGQR